LVVELPSNGPKPLRAAHEGTVTLSIELDAVRAWIEQAQLDLKKAEAILADLEGK